MLAGARNCAPLMQSLGTHGVSMIGLLWFDPDKTKTLPEKIGEAVAFYTAKYGGHPNTCIVNPATLGDQAPAIEGVTVKASKQVMPNHYFVGVDNEN